MREFENKYSPMNQTPRISDVPDPAELKGAGAVADRLVAAAGDFADHPRTDTADRKPFEAFYEQLCAFTIQHGTLVLEVDGTSFQYGGRDLSGGREAHEALAYSFYRDGIGFLSFTEGIELSELEEFFQIVGRRCRMEDALDGDMATDLWDADLSGIRYGVHGNFRGNDPLLDIAAMGTGLTEGDWLPSPDRSPGIDGNPESWRLLRQDLDTTRRMILEEENRDFDPDVLDIYLEILINPRDGDNIETLLTAAGDCFRRVLCRGSFRQAGNFLKVFRKIRQEYKVDKKPALVFLDRFLEVFSGPALVDILPEFEGKSAETLREMEEMLVQLTPESILTLGRMLPGIASKPARRHLISAIRHLAARDPRPLVQLVRDAKPAVSQQAILILSLIQPKDHLAVIREVARSGDPAIRTAAVMALTRYNPPAYEVLLPFIVDQEAKIRDAVFQCLVRERHRQTETALIDFILDADFTSAHRMPLLLLYRVLGRAGSRHSLEFLKHQLFTDPWRFNPVRAFHRLGAADALNQLGDPEAEAILKTAARSIWPTIRRACRKALETNDGNGNPIDPTAG